MLFYNFVVRCYGLLIHLAAFRSGKAKQWVAGRRNWRISLQLSLSKTSSGTRYWFHCASYGEFEQGRPLMEAIRKSEPQSVIVLSFFSPSGYEPFKNWAGADVVCYLPLDTRRNALDFLSIVKPQTVVFVKYEFWVNFLRVLKGAQIRTFLVSAVFKPHHPFFKWYGSIFRGSLQAFSRLFIQDERSGELLKSIGLENYEVSGDTRFDRVAEIRKRFEPIRLFTDFCAGSQTIVAGSTWPGDEKLLIEALSLLDRRDLKCIIAPHNIDEKHVGGLKKLLTEKAISFTCYTDPSPDLRAQVFVVDTIGLLSRLYFYADVAYVGGGFDDGIHNCLEPAVFLKPVIFYGEGYEKYNEAVDLINLQAAKNVLGTEEFVSELRHYLDSSEKRGTVKTTLENYFLKNTGATDRILTALKAGSHLKNRFQ